MKMKIISSLKKMRRRKTIPSTSLEKEMSSMSSEDFRKRSMSGLRELRMHKKSSEAVFKPAWPVAL